MSGTILLLPGLHGTAQLFGPLLAALPGALPVGWVVQVVTYPPAAGDYLAARAAVSVPDGAVVLVAESFSGPLAVDLAVELHAGGRLRGLVFAGSFVRSPMPLMPAWLVPGWAPRPPLWLAKRMLLNGWPDAQYSQALAEVIRTLSPRAALRRLRAVLASDARAQLPALVNASVLYLQARQDRVVGPQALADLALVKPVVVTLDAPHLILQTRPRECAQAIGDLLRR